VRTSFAVIFQFSAQPHGSLKTAQNGWRENILSKTPRHRCNGSSADSPNQIQLQVNLGDANRTETVLMENVSGQWKFGGFVRQPQPQQ
jgi:hypothetical protein